MISQIYNRLFTRKMIKKIYKPSIESKYSFLSGFDDNLQKLIKNKPRNLIKKK